MKSIIYIGDSYCASFRFQYHMQSEAIGQVHTHLNDVSHLNLAADALGLKLYSFGFAGRSWFYSRNRYYRALDHIKNLFTAAEAVVFVHTDAYRCPSIDDNVAVGLGFGFADPGAEHLVEPYQQWQKYLMDPMFMVWAQEQWFREINTLFADKKLIHFTGHNDSHVNYSILNGMFYTTPLVHLSIGELKGTDSQVIEQLANDTRYNHFNDHNNRALADVVVESVRNYSPGKYQIDKSKFYQPNPNAFKYPESGFGGY